MVKFCPNVNTSVEFKCVAQNLTTLKWIKNGIIEIYEIHQRYEQIESHTNGPYAVFVDSNNTSLDNQGLRFNVLTSRLKVADRLNIHHGDKIECVAYNNTEPTGTDYLTISYTGKLKIMIITE